MRVLCFGGSFNPIHHGHLIVARAVAESAGFEQVLLIPSAQPPHKQAGPDLASAAERLTMCQLAVQTDAIFSVSDIELHRNEPSYTLATVRALRENGLSEVTWLVGADTVSQLPRWHRPLELMQEVQFVAVRRPGWTIAWEELAEPYRGLQTHVYDGPQIDISATDIRRRVAAGRSIDFLTPPAVAGFIRERGLYRAPISTEG